MGGQFLFGCADGIGQKLLDSFEKPVGQNQGVITSDRGQVYHHLEPQLWQISLSHLTRVFQAAVEGPNETSATANVLIQIAKMIVSSLSSVWDGIRSRMTFVQNSLGPDPIPIPSRNGKGSTVWKPETANLVQVFVELLNLNLEVRPCGRGRKKIK